MQLINGKMKCNKCESLAIAYWPNIDPDIPSLPWCRRCLDRAKIKLMWMYEKNDDY